jgi:hypothetical protein
VYSEFSIAYTRIEDVDRVLAGGGLELVEIPRAALFLASKVFQCYRAHGGSRTEVLRGSPREGQMKGLGRNQPT